MAANIRFRSIYYNTSGASTVWKIEICDTESVAGIINFESTEPQINFEGLTQDLRPGIYPTFLRFGFYIRTGAKTRNGTVFGPSSSFIDDIFDSHEGRFIVNIYKDSVLYFVGFLLTDQCTFEDNGDSVYLLNCTVGDGLYKWKGKKFSSLFGTLKFRTVHEFHTGNPIDTTPLAMPAEFGTEWVMVEHLSQFIDHDIIDDGTQLYTTYARREQYASTSPGTGWVLQDNGLWAKEITYTNEVITDHSPDRYTIRRNIVNSTHRTIIDIIGASMVSIGLSDEYAGIMWDNASEWFEHSMPNTFDYDPFSVIRLPETQLNELTLQQGIEEILKVFFMRLYYSNGRYHFEQISYRDTTPFNRYTYLSDGTYSTTESAALDLVITSDDIAPEVGASYNILAPLKTVEVSIDLKDGNLLEGEFWKNDRLGVRYIGRIGRADGIEFLRLEITNKMNTLFDSATMDSLPPTTQLISVPHDWMILTSLRIVDTETGATYYLTGDANTTTQTTSDNATWESAEYEFEKRNRINFAFDQDTQEPNLDYSKTVVNKFLSEDLPGSEGATFDVYLSITYVIMYVNPLGVLTWLIINPTKVLYTFFADGKIIFLDDEDNEINGQSQRVYAIDNDVNNSVVVQNAVIFGDTGRQDKSIEIYNGTGWVKSIEWSIGGIAEEGQPILALCASEMMSLRTVAKRLYEGNFISPTPNNENRIQRLTLFYLPLNINKDTGRDDFQGEFVEIAKVAPPDVTLIDEPFDENNNDQELGDPIGGGGSEGGEPIDMTFETNEIIVDESTIDEVDIVNTAGVFVQAGAHCRIVNPVTGVYEVVVLTEDINPEDTVMYFTSHHFVNEFPDASFIIPTIDEGFYPHSLNEVYYYFKQGFTGTEIYAPNFNFLDPEEFGYHDINKRYTVARNGVRIFCKFGATDPLEKIQSYYYDMDNHKWLFYAPGLENETIEIHAF